MRRKACWLPLVCLGTSAVGFGQTQIDFRTQGKNLPLQSGTILPAGCSVGDIFLKTNAPAGVNLYGCTALNTWTLQSGATLPAETGNAGKLLSTDGTNTMWMGIAGDVNGQLSSTTVLQIQGRPVSPATPGAGQVLGWNGTTNRWEPSNVAGAVGPPGPAGPAGPQGPAGTGVPSAAGNTFKVLTNDGVNIVWSPLFGDVTGVATSVKVTGLNNHPVADVQLSDGQVLTWNGSSNHWEPRTPASGSGGTGPQGPAGPQGSAGPAGPQGPPGTSGTGSGGASMSSQLGDLAVTKTNSTSLIIGANCTSSMPCNARFGNVTYTFNAAASLAISGGSGMVFVYIDRAGNLTAGLQGITATCSGQCLIIQASSFPTDSLPIYVWTATNGTWDATGYDQRAFLSVKTVKAGTGLLVADESMGQTTFGADPSVIALRTSVPASSSTACTAGSWAMDTSYYYICVTSNSWRRISFSTF